MSKERPRTKGPSPAAQLRPGAAAVRPVVAPVSSGVAGWFGEEGQPFPPGQSWADGDQAYNFVLYSENAARVTLLLYGEHDLARPLLEFPLHPLVHKLRTLWFCKVPRDRAPDARYYAYSIDGPSPGAAADGHAFDPEKVLLDPYARDVYIPPTFDREAARRPGSNAGKAALSVLSRPGPPFDWDGPHRLELGPDTIIYELHVRGFTMSPTSGVEPRKRGTYAGLIEKIPYLKALGITAVELMPVYQFDPAEGNYWGYMPLSFFSPHRQFATEPDRAADEFRALVRAFHEAGIGVILDVVYNHTAEGDQHGPTYSYKGIDNRSYYLLTADPAAPYANHSGAGNTFRCGHPAARVLILESLRYWATEMRVDGFRFDLASIFTIGEWGTIDPGDSPLLTAIRSDPVLRHVHLIAEPWDADDLYQLGSHFPGQLWSQWNGRYRDDVRRFVKGDPGLVPSMMSRLYGSDDLFPDTVRESCRPFHSVNFVAAHDGFTLYDLVAYNDRRNWANGHGNTDGPGDNASWNCGWEGDEGLPAEVLVLRKRQAKNFCALLLLSNGIPMFRAGDEFLQTQAGNSNPYNQDNGTSWLDWTRLLDNADVARFFRRMIAVRKAHPSISRNRFWRDDVRWYGVGPGVDLGHDSHSLAYCLHGASLGDDDLYVMINAYWEPLSFAIQEGRPGRWRRVLDTSRNSPDDIAEPGEEPVVSTADYLVQPRSIVVLKRREPGPA